MPLARRSEDHRDGSVSRISVSLVNLPHVREHSQLGTSRYPFLRSHWTGDYVHHQTMLMWWSRGRRDAEERRHREALEIDRKILRHAEESAELAKKSNRGQLVALLVGSVLTVLTIVATFLVTLQPWKSGPVPSQVRAVVQLIPARNGIIPKPISAISVPPSYPPSQSDDHCTGWWKKWFGQQRAAPVDDPTIRISAAQGADATVVSASIEVYRSYKPAALTFIDCMHGAGPVPGTYLNVNLDRPNAYPKIVSDSGQLTPLKMPGAVININPGHTEYISLQPSGHRGMLYSWSIRLVVVVDQKQEKFTIGSPANPLRSWVGPIPSNVYDYSMQTHSWQS